jgi:hypothetical protein
MQSIVRGALVFVGFDTIFRLCKRQDFELVTSTATSHNQLHLPPTFPKSLQVGHEVMDLRSGRVITRRNLKELPLTDLVIQAVENMAIQQGLTTLKFTNRTAPSICPADWIAGVDYEEDDIGDSYYNQPDIEDQDDDLNEDTYDRIDNAELEDLFGGTKEQVEENDIDVEEENEFQENVGNS